MSQKEHKHSVGIRMSESLYRKIKLLSVIQGTSISAIVEEALDEVLGNIDEVELLKQEKEKHGNSD